MRRIKGIEADAGAQVPQAPLANERILFLDKGDRRHIAIEMFDDMVAIRGNTLVDTEATERWRR